ncbi:MAG: pantoate kinase [Candidatus Thorarchaeota archaeon]
MDEAQAFVPGHITGIFRIFDECEDPLRCGSLGAGFSIQAGTITKVLLREATKTDVEVTYNRQVIDAPVTGTVVREMLADYDEHWRVSVTHISDLPIGVGFGASGAGSLGTALALGRLLDVNMSLETAGQYAHRAEVANHTGLGDVIAQTVGGVEVRTRPGAPGIGEVVQLPPPNDVHIVLAGRPGIETKEILTNSMTRESINTTGDHILSRLLEDPSLESLIDCSKEFAAASGLMTPRVHAALNDLWNAGFDKASMVMLGDSVFTFCEESEVVRVHRILSKHWNDSEVLVTSIAEHGGGLV